MSCGPPIMIKFVLKELERLGFAPAQVVTTLEGKMKCGLGKCGRCNVGDQYICTDGPVFRYDQIQRFLEARRGRWRRARGAAGLPPPRIVNRCAS